MSPSSSQGTALAVLTATVARRYYLEGRSKTDIGDEFGLSRFKVARLIEAARTSGMVRIHFEPRGEVDVKLSSELQAAYGLRHSVVLTDVSSNGPELRRSVSRAAADLLTEIVQAGDVLGLAWARSLMDMTGALVDLPACTVVQLTGALAGGGLLGSSVELVRDVARIGGGHAFFFHTPMVVSDAATARSLRAQPEVARSIAHFDAVTKAVVGVGWWQPSYSTVVDALSEREWRQLHAQGVRAEISGIPFDGEGREVASALTERTIGITGAQLRAVPEVVGIVYDVVKAPAARAGVLGGFLDGLVTHSSLAREMLAIR